MMQNLALQDKLCLKFLLVIVPEVFAHMLRDWSRSKQSVQYYRDTYVSKLTFLHYESNKWSSAGLLQECRFIPHHIGWKDFNLFTSSLTRPGRSPSLGIRYKLQVLDLRRSASPPACLLSMPPFREVNLALSICTALSSSVRPLHSTLDMPAFFIFKTLPNHFFVTSSLIKQNTVSWTRSSGTTLHFG